MDGDIFIGSSQRAIKHANSLKEELEKRGKSLKCVIWRDKALFKLSKATLDGLEEIADHLKKLADMRF